MSNSDSDIEASGSSRFCFLCEELLQRKIATPVIAALETIKHCSKVRSDGK